MYNGLKKGQPSLYVVCFCTKEVKFISNILCIRYYIGSQGYGDASSAVRVSWWWREKKRAFWMEEIASPESRVGKMHGLCDIR